MSGETDPPKLDSDPIDADFEPAPPAADFVETPLPEKSRPGWRALGVTGVLAALFGTGAGAMLAGGGGDYAPDTLVEDVQVLAQQQYKFIPEERVLELVKDLDDRTREEILRVQGELTARAAGGGDAEAIAELTSQLTSINAQLDAIDVAAQEAGETEGLQVDELLARLEALEKLDEDEVASPRVANRAIRAMQRRVDELETDLATRSEAMQDLVSRLETAEAALAERGEAGDASESHALAAENATAIDGLTEQVAALAARSGETEVNDADKDRLERWVQELRAKDALNKSLLEQRTASQVAIVSLVSIEAASNNGRSFQDAFDRLEAALPDNSSVSKLKPLANTGAPTLTALQVQFDTARAEAEKLATKAEETGGDGWGWVRRALGGAVVVRGSGADAPAETGSAKAVLAAAATRLEERELAGAIGEIEKLDGSVGGAFDDWLQAANDRLVLDKGLENLRAALMDAGQ